VGIIGTLRDLCFGPPEICITEARPRGAKIATAAKRRARRCQIEELEERRLMAVDVAPHVMLGSVYFEEATGDDGQPDIIQVSFVGGAPGTTLNKVTISGDKRQDGLTDGDIFFDTAAGGLGAFKYGGLSIVSANGFTVNSVTVVDGGTQIVFDLSGFDAGEKLIFSVDADEAQYVDGNKVDANSLVEGAEFQRSIIIGEFTAPHYVPLTLKGTYWDEFDDEFAAATKETGLTLALPNDQYAPDHDYTDRTAGVVAYAAQIPLASLSGWVYHDQNDDGVFARGVEQGIGGVTLELLDANGNGTGVTTITSNAPGKVGYYEFLDLYPGTYGVREVHPDGWLDGKDSAGDHGGAAASEANGRVDKIFGAILNYGDHAVEYNFGELLPGSIRGKVGANNGPECKFDNPDIPLEGVRIDLLDAKGNILKTTYTNAQGDYAFTDLAPGIYSVREHQPVQYYDGGERVGSLGGASHDEGQTYSFITDINVGSDQHGIHYDFCEKIGVTLSGNVYHDRDNDGNFDRPGEEGIPGVVLKLLDGNGVDTGLRATTDSQGHYQFTNLRAGTYIVVEVHPAAWLDGKDTPGNLGGVADVSPPGDRISQIQINWGQSGLEYNFGELLPGSIAGRIHADDGPDCDFDHPHNMLQGVRVDLLDGQGNVIATTYTNKDGEYSFVGLRPGTYSVREHNPDGYFDGGERVGTLGGAKSDVGNFSFITGIAVGSDQHGVQYDFCEKLPGSISGRVHADHHEDCDFDDPEILLADVRIDLLDASGNVIATTYTDANGEYHFTGLRAGEYQVREHQPAAYYDGGERIGTAGGTKFDLLPEYSMFAGINITWGQDAIQYDFCEKVGVSLSGNVYHDRDDDGNFDRPSEEGIAGVLLKLLDANGNDTGLRATTNAQGFYQFTNLKAGTYSIVEVHPVGWLDGKDSPGNLGGVADLSPPGDKISQVTIHWAQAGVEYNFGELLPALISGRIHADEGPDCDFEHPEHMLEGVRVDLLDGQGNVIATTYTDKLGKYEFTGLRPGTYSVREHQPVDYFDGGEKVGTAGGAKSDAPGFSFFTGIQLSSGVSAINYDFCEKPGAEISGYVYIDGAPIFTNKELTAEEIAAVRDGRRTPDDTPLAGVVLELRNGTTGAPILIGEALPGSYSGAATDPIRVVTNGSGYYHFGGLHAGLYAVVEVQPQNVIDHLDTAGTLGGFAVNPVGLSTNSGIPTPSQQAIIEQFRTEYGTDVILAIPLHYGEHSQENNFSEVTTTVGPPPPPPPPPHELPPRPPVFGPAILPPAKAPLYVLDSLKKPPFVFNNSRVIGVTWHLSVVNAGWPRSMTPDDIKFQLTAAQIDAASWQRMPMDGARWTLATVSGNKVLVLRDEAFGNARSVPVTGDFNGDGVTDIGVFIDGQWFLDLNGNGRWDEGDLWAQLGSQEDTPVTGDWDADGKTDIGIYGPAWSRDPWAIEREPGLPDADNFPTRPAGKMKNMPPTPEDATSGARILKRTVKGKNRADLIDHVFHYGNATDVPITGDWNGDGIRQIGTFRNGQWVLDIDGDGRFTEADAQVTFGQTGDKPVVGDFNGDGVDEIGVYRAGKWILDTNGNRHLDAQDRAFELGDAGDTPVVGDWNDDGVDDPGTFHPGQAGDRVGRRAG